MIPGAVHRSSGSCFTAEENPGESRLGDRQRGCATSNGFKWCHLPPNEVGRIGQPVRSGKARKEEEDGVGFMCLLSMDLRPKTL